MPKTFTFDHPQLGPMTGIISPENVVQFKAVPFATIPARFKRSILLESLEETDRDFTKQGYACPQVFGNDVFSGGPIPGQIPHEADEFKCLILQINVPLECLQSKDPKFSKLPVLIYIHGGGFVLGKIDEHHNTALMVEQSISNSQPVISASIQYRLGALGFIQTPETENSNLALYDQRNALLWLQKFIGGFGGDATQTTIFGESAGSMSICVHMMCPAPASGPLFRRVILMSGSIGPMTAPALPPRAEHQYEEFLKTLKIEERGDAGLARLREVDVQDIVDATMKMSGEGSMWLPVQDKEWFGTDDLTWEKCPELISKCGWVDEVVLGCTSFEGTTFMANFSTVAPAAFVKGVAENVGERRVHDMMKVYQIDPDMDDNLFLTRGLRWVGDVVFDAPVHRLAQCLAAQPSKKVYRYIFDVRNPFPNSTLYQQPHHWVDVYYVFKTFQFRYPTKKLKDISTRHAQLWLDVATGQKPWTEYKYTGQGDETIMVADEREGWVERKVVEEENITELSWRRLEALWESWQDRQGQTFEPLRIAPLEGKKLV